MNRPGAAALRSAVLLAIVLAVCAGLTGCGGGDGGGRTQVIIEGSTDASAPACQGCAPGILTGSVSTGRALAGADVRVFDAHGNSAAGTTDPEGRYRIALGQLTGTLIVQARVVDGGRPLTLHAAQGVDETRYGRRAIHLTPLTELITAEVLGAPPQSLLARGEADHRRISERALHAAETRVQALVQPLLAAAGAANDVDLRSSEFADDGRGLDLALELLRVEAAGGGWRVGVVGHAAAAQLFDPAGSTATPLPAPADATALRARMAAAQAGAAAALQAMTALYAGDAPPPDAAVAALLADEFRHGGLARQDYVERVLQRRDAAVDGGFSLRGARFEQPRVVDLPGATGALVTFAVRPAAPFATVWHTMLMRPSAGGWQLAGDGRAAIVTLRHAAVLLAAPLPPAQLRALPGAHCALAAAALGGEACAIAGGSGGLPEGTLDLGESGESLFGVLGLFRAASGDTGTRLSAAATHSRLLGAPSAAVRRYLLFEVDSRAVDARVARVRVSGGPLPAGGVVLLPPPLTVNGPAFEHWMLHSDPDSGWPAVPWGWCGAETDAGTCSAQWTALRAGSLLRFELLDEAGALIETIEAALPPEPPQPPALLAEVAQRFARLEAADPTAAPGYAQVLGYGSLTSSTTLSWRPPSGASSVELQRAWQQADPTGSGGVETQRSRSLLMPATPAPIVNTFVPRAGWRSTWWSVRLTATDAEGMRHVHALSPANPH